MTYRCFDHYEQKPRWRTFLPAILVPFVALVLFAPALTLAAIARDRYLYCGYSATSPLTCSVAVGLANGIIVIQGNGAIGNTDSITSVTYNGISGHSAATDGTGVEVGTRSISEWYVLEPTVTASTTLSIAFTGNFFDATVVVYGGVNQTTPFEGVATSTSGASNVTSISQAITTVTNNDWVIGEAGAATTPAAGGGTVLLNCGVQSSLCSLDSGGAVTPAGSYTLNFNGTPAHLMSIAVFSLVPAGGSPAASPKLPDPIFWGWW